MARKTAVVRAVEDTAAALQAQYRAEPVPEVRTRRHALWRRRLGEGPTVAASVVGVGRRSVQRWLGWYREGGLAAGRDWIEARCGVAYTVAGIHTLLERLRIRLKAPRPRHTKADPQAQETGKKGGSENG